MRVRCTDRKFSDLPGDLIKTERLDPIGMDNERELADRQFTVCGMVYSRGSLWFIVDFRSPYSLPAMFCDVVDSRISRYFVFRQGMVRTGPDQMHVRYEWGFPELVNDDTFYARTVDGDPTAIKIFKRYKRLLNYEYPDPAVEEKGIFLQERWVQCPKCWDAWEETFGLGMAQCPKCKTIVHNPLYKDVLPLATVDFPPLDMI